MADEGEQNLDKRVEDIRAVRKLLAESNDLPLIYPWAFFVWALLVGAGTVIHYVLYRTDGIDVRSSLLWIWFPILVLGAITETVSFSIKVGKEEFALFNRRVGNAILACIATSVVLFVVVMRLAFVALTPGVAMLLSALPLVFFAQISYTSLFIETFIAVAAGLLFELARARGLTPFVIAGSFAAALYAVSGFHVLVAQRRHRV